MTDDYRRLEADEAEVGDRGPEVVFRDLSVPDFVKYAGASGDFNPVHYHESYAKEAGHPDVFAQGMFTAGIAARMVSDWLGLANIKTYRVRATSRIWPGDTITASGQIVDKEEKEETVVIEIEFSVTNQDDEDVMTGGATAKLPSESED